MFFYINFTPFLLKSVFWGRFDQNLQDYKINKIRYNPDQTG
jgi:hypothetical protein